MKLSTCHLPKYLLILSLLFCFKTVSAQYRYEVIVSKIDSLSDIGLPKSALKEVDKLDSLAHKNNDAPGQIKAAIYRMNFQSYLEDNALVPIINRLKADIEKADYPVKSVLQSLLAQMYWNYYEQYRYQFNQRSALAKPDSDFTKWDLQTIINETSHLYNLSLKNTAKEQATSIAVLDGVLEGDSSTRYLRPTLYDLLVNRAFDFFLSDEPGLTKPRLPFSLNNADLFKDSHTFSNLVINSTDTASTYYKGIKYLQQTTAFHLRDKDEEALADIDLQRLKFLYLKSSVNHKDSLYMAALTQIATDFAAKPISSEALVLQGQYYQRIDSLTMAYNIFKKAYTTYPESLGGKNAVTLIKQIEQKRIDVIVEDVNVPGKPLLALLNYTNISSAKVAIYRLSAAALKEYSEGSSLSSYAEQIAFKLGYLKKLNPVQDKDLSWANRGDYRNHSLEFKIDALTPGNYVLMVKDGATNTEPLTGLSNFKISELAYTARVNPDDVLEVRVMDRESGKPLNGVHIGLNERSYRYNNTLNKNEWVEVNDSGISDKDGLFYSAKLSSGNNISYKLISHGDTLSDGPKYVNGARNNFNGDDTPEDKTVLFTDRQIYRPGQAIYFKGLQLQTLKGKSKIIPNKNITVEFLDVNSKQVSSLKLSTNAYGTFSGSFVIPQTMLNGNVQLKTEDGQIDLRVEEYKRPTFQVEFSPLKESYKLNDTVLVKGKVTAFSGYGLSQAKVAYHIMRTQPLIIPGRIYRGAKYRTNYNAQPAEIKTDTITTDDQGGYQLKFKAIPGDDINLNYTYMINADVTDASGETHTAATSFTIGNHDIQISCNLPELIFAKDSINIPTDINNLNGQPQKGEVKVVVYALKNAEKAFKNRLWEKPDQLLINENDFKNDFPSYAYNNEDAVSSWHLLNEVDNSKLELDGEKPGIIQLEQLRKQPSGIYKIVINAHNEKGDTTSITQYVKLVNETAKPLKVDDWLIPVQTIVKPGTDALFLAGINQKINVLMERYNGVKLMSSKWITIEKGQQNIKIPITDTDRNVAVQFMMVYQNRVYLSYQKIFTYNPDKNLNIKLLTFHNKLQPGQKEQWKLQISNQNNEKQSAEMLADLYDASLDDITPPANWLDAMKIGEKYQPNYFAWNSYDFVMPVNTNLVNNQVINYNLLLRDYEKLNLFGYSYYGGYNSNYQNYLQRRSAKIKAAENDKHLQAEYLKKAALIKNGYDISGRVIDQNDKSGIPGVSINIKGMELGTITNSQGNFKIRVPVNAVLVFKFIGYVGKEVSTTKSENITVKLKQNASSLNEVVVVGYGIQRKTSVTGAVTRVSIRGLATPAALQGQLAAVQVINDNSDQAYTNAETREISPELKYQKPIALRKNFNETAFFYPQLQTNANGEILIDFTIPEALTRWKFRGLALTKELQSGYIENTVVTQKQLSISANTPRFLREGDTITISARLANLTNKTLKGKVQMQLFNALNMQPVYLFVNSANALQDFEIAGSSTKSVSFSLVIPAGLDALTYRLTADAGAFTDGEENTLPVLPNRMLVTESMPMMVRTGQTRNFTFDKLLNQNSSTLKNKTLTLEYTQNPAWYAVQALPYMMEFPYECSEQVFSRYFANSLASNLVNKLPAIKQVVDQWKNSNSTELLSNLEKNPELKETLIEETPWLNDAVSESEQKKRIALLFDLNKMSDELKLNLDKLRKRQLPDGGFTWFGGDYADRFISQHILEGIGELYHLGIADKQSSLEQVADGAIKYLDSELIGDEKQREKNKERISLPIDHIEIQAWFARSYFVNKPMTKELKSALNKYLIKAAGEWTLKSVYEQGMIALTMQRYKKSNTTVQIEKSLLETAQHSDDLGMYWAKNRQGYFWYEAPIETQSLLIELFTEAGDNAKAVDEMKIWLLRNKQTSDWKTTKATAAACYALLLKGSNLLTDTSRSVIKLGGKVLEELKPGINADAGTGYIKTSWADEQIKPELGKVEIRNNGKTISWGALHWQYLENLDKITSSQTNIHLERKYFIKKQTDAGQVLTAVDASHQPKTGDLLKVVVYLKADRDFEYVQLKDMRPSGTEPVDALSAYKYQDGLYYYQVTKDAATNFFISYLNKGSYVFEYQLRVAQPGNFSTGITSIQSMYAPEFNAHSQGGRLVIIP